MALATRYGTSGILFSHPAVFNSKLVAPETTYDKSKSPLPVALMLSTHDTAFLLVLAFGSMVLPVKAPKIDDLTTPVIYCSTASLTAHLGTLAASVSRCQPDFRLPVSKAGDSPDCRPTTAVPFSTKHLSSIGVFLDGLARCFFQIVTFCVCSTSFPLLLYPSCPLYFPCYLSDLSSHTHHAHRGHVRSVVCSRCIRRLCRHFSPKYIEI